jgi:hypothetical protein
VAAADNAGLAEVSLTTAGLLSSTQTRAQDEAPRELSTDFTLAFATLPPTGGTLTLTASARDLGDTVVTTGPVVVSVLDVVPPALSSSSPSDGATDVDPDASLVLAFSEPVAAGPEHFALACDGQQIGLGVDQVTADGATVTVRPPTLPQAAACVLTLAAGLPDAAGNPLGASIDIAFDTAGFNGPQLQSLTPPDGAEAVAVTSPIRLLFTQDLSAGSVDGFRVLDAEGLAIAGERGLQGAELRFAATPSLPAGAAIRIELTPGITDLDGNPLLDASGVPVSDAQPLVFGFTTADFGIAAPLDGALVPEDTDIGLIAVSGGALGASRVVFSVDGEALPPVATPSPFTATFRTPLADDAPELVISASAQTAAGVELARDSVTVTLGVPLEVRPRILGVPLGDSARLVLTVPRALPADVAVELRAADPSIAEPVAPSLVLSAGDTRAVAALRGLRTGATSVEVRSSLGVATVTASVGLMLQENGQRQVQVRLLPEAATAPVAVTATSSEPSLVQVIDASDIGAGERDTTLTLAAGSIDDLDTAVLDLAADTVNRELTAVVVPPFQTAPPAPRFAPVGLAVRPPAAAGELPLALGQAVTLDIPLLAERAGQPTSVTITASRAGVVQFPDAVTIDADSRSLSLDLLGLADGEAVLRLRAGDAARTLRVYVGQDALGHLPLTLAGAVGVALPEPIRILYWPVPVGGTQSLRLPLLESVASSDTEVRFGVTPSGVVEVPETVLIPAGSRLLDLQVRGLDNGVALLTLRFADEVRVIELLVGTAAEGRLPTVLAPPVGVEMFPPRTSGQVPLALGESRVVQVPLLGAPTQAPVTVNIDADAPGIVAAPAMVEIPVGSRNAALVLSGLDDGRARLTLRYGDQARSLEVAVGTAAPDLLPPVLAPGVGVDVAP